MKTISKFSTLILMVLIISCNKEKEIQENKTLPDIEIYSDKDLYSSSERIILTLKNNNEKEYSVKCIQPPFKVDPWETREIWENDIWTQCPIPPFAEVYFSYEPLTETNPILFDTIKNLTYWESGIYRLKYRLRLENIDTVFYSNEFEIIENE